MDRRDFLRVGGSSLAAAIAGQALSACGASPAKATQADAAAQAAAIEPEIIWRMQTYAGSALGQHVCKQAVDAFNTAAAGRMKIELYYADELVPQGELVRSLQNGVLEAIQTDEDSAQSPVDISVFGAYFPFGTEWSLDVPVLWNWYGLDKIWEEAYKEIENVTWLSTGSWDPCNFSTTKPIRSIKDLEGLRVYMFPTGGQFMSRFGVSPVSIPYEDVQMAMQTGELDGVCWSGITEVYTVGWADVTKYYLTNPISGAWAGSYLVNTEAWEKLPDDLKMLFKMHIDYSHYYRQHWYWWGEAHYRVNGGKLQLTTIPTDEWDVIRQEAYKFWDEVAQRSARCAQVVQILKEYSNTLAKAGTPYRWS